MMFGHRKSKRLHLPYLEGTLPPDQRRKLERHLSGCESCRAVFIRIKTGHEFAARMALVEDEKPSQAPAFDPALTEARLGKRARRNWDGLRMRWALAVSAPRTVGILAAVVIAQAALLVVLNRNVLFGTDISPAASISGIEIGRFRSLDIADLPLNAHPHVATEGYVRRVWMDTEEKTLHFMLASKPEGESPFIICEILNPERISPPRAGSRVKVYGVSRYDGQAGREWNEVNPVLDIAVLKR